MKEMRAPFTRETPASSERSVERAREEVRGIFSRTAQGEFAKAGKKLDARRAKGQPFELRVTEIPRRVSVPENPALEELRLEAEAILFSPESPTKEEALMLMKRGVISSAWERSGISPDEVALILFGRRKTRAEWIQEASRSLLSLNMSEEEAAKKAARIVDDMMIAHTRV